MKLKLLHPQYIGGVKCGRGVHEVPEHEVAWLLETKAAVRVPAPKRAATKPKDSASKRKPAPKAERAPLVTDTAASPAPDAAK